MRGGSLRVLGGKGLRVRDGETKRVIFMQSPLPSTDLGYTTFLIFYIQTTMRPKLH